MNNGSRPTHYSLLIIHYSNGYRPTHYSLLIIHYSNGSRPTHYSLLIIHYSTPILNSHFLAAGCSGIGCTMLFSTVTTTPFAISTLIVWSSTSATLP